MIDPTKNPHASRGRSLLDTSSGLGNAEGDRAAARLIGALVDVARRDAQRGNRAAAAFVADLESIGTAHRERRRQRAAAGE